MEKEWRLKVTAISELPQIESQLLSIAQLMKEQGLISEQVANKIKSNVQSEMTERARLRVALEQERQATAQLNLQKQESATRSKELGLEMVKVRKNSDSLLSGFGSLKTLMASMFGIYELKNFTTGIIEAKTQMDRFKVGLDAMLQSKELSDKLAEQVKQLALDSPLSFEALQEATFKMIGFGFETEKVVPILNALGNMAAVIGNEKLPFIAKAMADVQNKQVLMGQEIKQFAENGVNIYGLLAKSMDITKEEAFKLADAHKISYAQVEKAILQASEAGGLYYNQMKIQSSLLGGEVEKLKDQYFFAKAAIGDYAEGGLKSAIARTRELLEATTGSSSAIERSMIIIGGIIKTWLTYQTVVKGAALITTGFAAAKRALLVVQGQSILALESYTGITIASTTAQIGARNAAISLNTALRANPFTAIAAALAGLVAAYYAFKAVNTDVLAQAEEDRIKRLEKLSGMEVEKEKVNQLIDAIGDHAKSNEVRKESLVELNKLIPEQSKLLVDLKTAEKNLDIIRKESEITFKNRAALIINEVKLERERVIALSAANKMLDAQEKLKTASTQKVNLGLGQYADYSMYDLIAKDVARYNKELVDSAKNIVILEKEIDSLIATKKEVITVNDDVIESEKVTAGEISEIWARLNSEIIGGYKAESKELELRYKNERSEIQKRTKDVDEAYEELKKLHEKYTNEVAELDRKYWKLATDGLTELKSKTEVVIETSRTHKKTQKELAEESKILDRINRDAAKHLVNMNEIYAEQGSLIGLVAKNLNSGDGLVAAISNLSLAENELAIKQSMANDALNKANYLKISGKEKTAEYRDALTVLNGANEEVAKSTTKLKESQAQLISFLIEKGIEAVVNFGKAFTELSRELAQTTLDIYTEFATWKEEFTGLSDTYVGELEIMKDNTDNFTSVLDGQLDKLKNGNLRAWDIINGTLAISAYNQASSYTRMIQEAQRKIDALEEEKDRTIAYYDEMTAALEEKTNREIALIDSGLAAQLNALNVWYDTQMSMINSYYDEILNQTVQKEDEIFNTVVESWQSKKDAAEQALLGEKGITEENYDELIDLRKGLYGELTTSAESYYQDEKSKLDQQLADGVISQSEYATAISQIDEALKDRKIAINAIIQADRQSDLDNLRDSYLAKKIEAEQNAANQIEAIQSQHAINISNIENSKKDSVLSINYQLFEANRQLYLQQVEMERQMAKARAWANGLVIGALQQGQINKNFDEIRDRIAGTSNPYSTPSQPTYAPTDEENFKEIVDSKNRYFKGTEYVEGQDGIDKVPSLLTKGEGVIERELNAKKLAAGLTNKVAIDYAIQYKGLMEKNGFTLPTMSVDPKLLNFVGGNGELVKEIKSLKKELSNLKQVSVSIQNGRPSISERRGNRVVKWANINNI